MVSTEVYLDTILLGSWLYPLVFSGKTSQFIPCWSKKEDLKLVGEWVEQESVEVSIDSEYKVSELGKAWDRQNDRTKTGRVVIQVHGGW